MFRSIYQILGARFGGAGGGDRLADDLASSKASSAASSSGAGLRGPTVTRPIKPAVPCSCHAR
jgi:hypothetical protein